MTKKIDKNFCLFLLLLSLSIGLYFLDKKSVLNSQKDTIYRYFTIPTQNKIYDLWQNLKSRFVFIRQTKEPTAELGKMKERLGVLESENSRIFVLEEENKILREQLGAKMTAKKIILPARVIGFSQNMRLDSGEKDGVGVGAAVVWQNNLLGKIIKTSSRQSLAETIFNSTLKVAAITDKGTKGLTVGEGNTVYLTMALSGATLATGDKVFSSGEDGIFPAGFLIGEVEKVEKTSTEVFQKAKLKININFSDLKIVFVNIE